MSPFDELIGKAKTFARERANQNITECILDPRALEIARHYWETTNDQEGALVIEELDKTLDMIEKEKAQSANPNK